MNSNSGINKSYRWSHYRYIFGCQIVLFLQKKSFHNVLVWESLALLNSFSKPKQRALERWLTSSSLHMDDESETSQWRRSFFCVEVYPSASLKTHVTATKVFRSCFPHPLVPWIGHSIGPIWHCYNRWRYVLSFITLGSFWRITFVFLGPGGYVAAIKSAQLGLRASSLTSVWCLSLTVVYRHRPLALKNVVR